MHAKLFTRFTLLTKRDLALMGILEPHCLRVKPSEKRIVSRGSGPPESGATMRIKSETKTATISQKKSGTFGAVPSASRILPEALQALIEDIERTEERQPELFGGRPEPVHVCKSDPLLSVRTRHKVGKDNGPSVKLVEVKRTLSEKDRVYQKRRTDKIEGKKYVQLDSWAMWVSMLGYGDLRGMERAQRRPFAQLCVKVHDALWAMTREDVEAGRLDWSETACAFTRMVRRAGEEKPSLTRLARMLRMSERSQKTLERLRAAVLFLAELGMMWHIQGKRYEAERLFTWGEAREMAGIGRSRAGTWKTLIWDIELFELTHALDKKVAGERKRTAFFKHEPWLFELHGKTYSVARTCVALRPLMRKQERKAGAQWVGIERLAQQAGIISVNRQGWYREREEIKKALEEMKRLGVLESWAMVGERVKLVWMKATSSSVRRAERDPLVCKGGLNATSSSEAHEMGRTGPREEGKESVLGDPHRSPGNHKARKGRRLPPKSELLPRSSRKKRRK